ncbi:flavodoxin [Sediminispirochaeta bajacaliforniensis]|uniref:flavodoxin n=1 Tax=Sediminispirochaeta bajacaliforniensis TaxID=148 RepID=UPI00036A8E7E|nr:flavodoxin [Sediminispirochaeta bajacaliforniensis]
MSKIAIFYGSTTGNTKDVAERIQNALGDAELFDIADTSVEKMEEYDAVVVGTSTWGAGDLQDDWEMAVGKLGGVTLAGKKMAFFGLGDQESYSDTFVDGMGQLYDAFAKKDVSCIGQWPTDGYDFEESSAVRDNAFVGLALDEDNQSDLSDGRIASWAEQVKKEL